MKKIILLIICLFFLNGCYDYVEIDDLVIISGILIDYKDNQFQITSQVLENESESKVKVYTNKCNMIDECISEISKLSNKDIFISHLKVLIITENVIKNNVNYYDFFLRNSKSKMNFDVYYVENKYKDELLNIYKDGKGSSLYLKDLIKFNNKIFSSSSPLPFLELMYKKMEYGITPIYPNIVINNNNNEKSLYLQDLVVFNDNYKKILLNDQEGIYYNIVSNKCNKTNLLFDCDKDKYSLTINNAKTKYKWKNNTLYLNIKLSTKLNNYNCKYDLNKSDSIKKLTTISNNQIKKNILNLINKSKNNNVDFFGFGNYIYKHDKRYFDFKNKNWNNEVKKLNIKVNIDTTITSIGELRK